MKKFNSFFAVGLLALSFVFSSCEENVLPVDTPAPPITKDVIRVRLNLPESTSASTGDTYVMAGGFKTNAWTPDKSALEFKKSAGGFWTVDLPLSEFGTDEVEYKVVRNAKNGADAWKFVEKTAKCEELGANRKIAKTSAGQLLDITVENFRNTGTCPN